MCGGMFKKPKYTAPPVPAPAVSAPNMIKNENLETKEGATATKSKGKRRLTIGRNSGVGTGVNV